LKGILGGDQWGVTFLITVGRKNLRDGEKQDRGRDELKIRNKNKTKKR
jgi:hypothetical protein